MARFAPTRAGIIGLWDYADEEFVFADGWLVWRGPNGSGKTKALESLFPFLFDGNISPRRLNPFASIDRTMKSNLLFRGKENGLGYVWMEFYDGERHLTIGIGLRANKFQDAVKRWHFVVEGRVGVDFGLITTDDRVCNRKELIAQLPEGAVTDQVRDYRDRVNTALFSLDPERYEQMIELILTLRRPQLAKELDPETLSDTLSAGLRPIDEKLIAEAAKSFEDMEEVARTLASLRSADEQIERFLTLYGTYVRAHAKLAVVAVDARLGAVDDALREEAEAAQQVKDAQRELAEREAGAEFAAEQLSELQGTLEGLKDSDAYRDRLELEDLRKTVDALRDQAETLAGQAADRQVDAEEAQAEVDGLEEDVERAAADVARQDTAVAACAERAGMPWEPEHDPDRLRQRAGASIAQRRSDIREVETAAANSDAADARRGRAETETGRATEALDTAVAALGTAHTAVNTEREALEGRVREWARAAAEALGVDLKAEAPDWVAEADAETAPTLRDLAIDRTRSHRKSVEDRKHHASVELAGVRQAVGKKQAEAEAVRGEHDDAPKPPGWRDGSRPDRAGVPLWQAVRFKEGVDDAEAAAIEAALEAAGLLDAWIGEAADASDSAVRALPVVQRPAAPVLADYLECEDEAAKAAVGPVLDSIAVRPTADVAAYSAVGVNGQFAHGSLEGRARKSAPEYIGATARQRRREQRLRELDTEIGELNGNADALQGRIGDCDTALSALDRALRSMPSVRDLVKAFNDVASRELVVAERRGDLDGAQAELNDAVSAQLAAVQHLAEAERACALVRSDIERVGNAVSDFKIEVNNLSAALKSRTGLETRLGTQRGRASRILQSVTEVTSKATEAQEKWKTENARLQSIQQSLGAEAADIFDRIKDTGLKIERAETAVKSTAKRHADAVKAEGRAEQKAEGAAEKSRTAIGEARAASFALRPFCEVDLLAILGCTGHRWPAADEDPGAAVLPAAIAELLDDLRRAVQPVQASENSAKGTTTRVNNALQEIMAQLPATGLDHHVRWDSPFGVITVEVDTDEGRRPIGRYASWLHEQHLEQAQLLTEREQHVLEDALLTSLTGQIHHRVLESKDLVEKMDDAMRTRKTSSGLRLTVSWRLDENLPQAERALYALFDGAPARLSTQMGEIRKYFADKIKQERARSKAETTYRELLADVLDYRKWRKFKFTLLRAGGARQELTKKAHSGLSGGEQSVALHLPLFAAANAVFGSAAAHAPRLIGLDEAFAGVDDKGCGELMSLAAEFDLHLVMTGYDLWATYPDVRGSAHYTLGHDEATAVVSSLLMVWNGAEQSEVYDFDGSLAEALGSPGTRQVTAHG
ncbi:TIGR02680 family protein [Glycomyces sp. MUSA5-2]|uniref:TIGR02680 family protein n=1 Tax=Glycomyces sp. MUSA5-2 TaxID=2053002 RepID=UPI003009593F